MLAHLLVETLKEKFKKAVASSNVGQNSSQKCRQFHIYLKIIIVKIEERFLCHYVSLFSHSPSFSVSWVYFYQLLFELENSRCYF